MKALIFGMLFCLSANTKAQVAINTDGSKPNASAMLDIKSTNHGLLVPRMTQVQRNAIVNPATALLIYQTDIAAGYYYNIGVPASPLWLKLGQLTLPFSDSSNAAPYTHVFKITTNSAHFAPAIYGITKSQEGVAIVGENSSGASDGIGVRGTTNTEAGTGVAGYNTHSSGTGWGVSGSTNGRSGGGVVGFASSDTGITYGIKGGSHSTKGFGVYGTGRTYGVYGISYEAKGRATTGEATGTESIGVYAKAIAANSTGVWGEGAIYDFYASGPGTNYGAASSIRWKREIRSIDYPLDKINAMRGVYFTWDGEHGGRHDVGMIAEEVGKLLPEIVVFEKNGIDASGMDYSKLTPLLLEGIKALKAENDLLKARVEALEKQMNIILNGK